MIKYKCKYLELESDLYIGGNSNERKESVVIDRCF